MDWEGAGEVAFYSVALGDGKFRCADGTSDDPPVLLRDLPPRVLIDEGMI